jgi:hypothetical protein
MPKRRAGSSPVPGTRFFFAKLTSALIYYCQKVWVVLFVSVMLLASAHAQLPQPTAEDPSGGCHEHHKTPASSAPSALCCQAGHQSAIVETGSARQKAFLIKLPLQLPERPASSPRIAHFATSHAYEGDPPQRTPLRI